MSRGVMTSTEDTITQILVELLSRKGVNATSGTSVSIGGKLRKPDLYLVDEKVYLGEAKLKERDLFSDVAKIYNNYLKYYKEIKLGGAFAILYPESISKLHPDEIRTEVARNNDFSILALFPPDDPRRSFHRFTGTIEELAEFIARIVLKPSEKIELSVSDGISVLREAARTITSGLQQVKGEEIDGMFGGKEVFEYILQYEEKDYPLPAMRAAAAFLLINQVLFYHILSKKHAADFPEANEDLLQKPADLNHYFQKVMEKKDDYRVIFSYNISSFIPQRSIDAIKQTIIAIKAISPEKADPDLIGTIFHDLIPLEIRKDVAAYYTNPLAAELLAYLAIDKSDAKVADFACGSGGLLVAAYHKKKELLLLERSEKERSGVAREFTPEDHRRFVGEDLVGVDVMSFAAQLAAVNLVAQAIEWSTDHANIAVFDSTELFPGKTIPPMEMTQTRAFGQTTLLDYSRYVDVKEKKRRGTISIDGAGTKDIKLESYDVVVMNPPFTRQERIPDKYKGRLEERFESYKKYIHGRLGYHGYFIFLADKFLKIGSKLALVIPASVLRLESFEGIRRLLADNYIIQYMIISSQRSAFSESTMFREILFVARKAPSDLGSSKDDNVHIVYLKHLPSTKEEAHRVADEIVKGRSVKGIRILDVPRLHLASDVANWYKFISLAPRHVTLTKTLDLLQELRKQGLLVSLKEALAKIGSKLKYGRKMSISGFSIQKLFVTQLSVVSKGEDLWFVTNEDTERVYASLKDSEVNVKLLRKDLIPAFRRHSGVNHMHLRKSDYIMMNPTEDVLRVAGIELRKDFSRTVTQDYENYGGNVFLVYRFDISAPGTKWLSFYSQTKLMPTNIFWTVPLEGNYGKTLTLWFNSIIWILQLLSSRIETRGAFIEIFGYALDNLLVPSPEVMKSNEKELISIFDKVGDTESSSILDQLHEKTDSRKSIDEAWLRILKAQVDLGRVYDETVEEIVQLRKTMKGD